MLPHTQNLLVDSNVIYATTAPVSSAGVYADSFVSKGSCDRFVTNTSLTHLSRISHTFHLSNTSHLSRTYADKKPTFKLKYKQKPAKTTAVNNAARDWLGVATGVCKLTIKNQSKERTNLKSKGKIDLSEKEQAKYAEDMGYHASLLNLLSHPPSTAAFNQLDKIVTNMEHHNGATHTKKYGDMRTYNGARATNQRASNTQLLNTVGAAVGHSNDTNVGVSGHQVICQLL